MMRDRRGSGGVTWTGEQRPLRENPRLARGHREPEYMPLPIAHDIPQLSFVLR